MKCVLLSFHTEPHHCPMMFLLTVLPTASLYRIPGVPYCIVPQVADELVMEFTAPEGGSSAGQDQVRCGDALRSYPCCVWGSHCSRVPCPHVLVWWVTISCHGVVYILSCPGSCSTAADHVSPLRVFPHPSSCPLECMLSPPCLSLLLAPPSPLSSPSPPPFPAI